MTRIGCVLIIGVFVGVVQAMYWDIYYNTLNNRKRLLQMETMIVTEIYRRFQKTWWIRSLYEESPYFEIGYVFGEIMEKYRKMIEYMRMVKKGEQSLFHTVDWLETVQQLYYEIYHLTMMIHEIPRKWKHVEAYEKLAEYQRHRISYSTHDSATALHKAWRQMKHRIRGEEREKRLKRKAKSRSNYMKNMMKKVTKMRMNIPSYGYVGDSSQIIYQKIRMEWIAEEQRNRERIVRLNLTDPDPNKEKSMLGSGFHAPAYRGGTTQAAWTFDYGWEPNYDWWSQSVIEKPEYEYFYSEEKRRR